MKKVTKSTSKFGAIELFNIKAGAHSLKEAIGKTIEIRMACVGEDTNANNEPVSAAALITSDGIAYTTISATAVDLIDSLIDIIEDNSTPETIKVKVETRKSNAGRDFIVLSIA